MGPSGFRNQRHSDSASHTVGESESKLTLKHALEIASAMELAAKDAKVIRGTTNELQVNKVTGSQTRP